MNPSARPCEAVLLAAGAGQRLGSPKALLELGGRWMLPRIAAALLAGGARRVHLVLRPQEWDEVARRGLPPNCLPVLNPAPERGRNSSLACGLARLDAASAALIHPCDVPLLLPEDVARLIAAWEVSADREGKFARPVTRAGRGGHPLLVGRDRVAEVRSLPPERSLRELVRSSDALRIDVPITGFGPFLGVDVPEQKEWLEAMLAETPQSGSHQR